MNLRYLWRSLSLVFVLWFALSPVLCFASETATNTTTESAIQSDFSITDTEISSGQLLASSYIRLDNSSGSAKYSLHDYIEFTSPYSSSFQSSNAYASWIEDKSPMFSISFKTPGGYPIFDDGSVIDFFLSGFNTSLKCGYTWSIVNVGGGSSHLEESLDVTSLTSATLYLFPTTDMVWDDRYTLRITDFIIIDETNNTFGLSISNLEIPFDVCAMQIDFMFDKSADNLTIANAHNGFDSWKEPAYYYVNYDSAIFRYEEVDQTSGLLSGIIEWLRSIRDGIIGVKDGVTNVVNGITQLPSKLWTAIENGLKGLFVPNETDITAMKDKWDTLLSDRFGVVYESGALLIDIANSVQESSTKETISFPSVSYNFSGTDFTFGGYEVDVIPNGFEFLADILKGVIDIVCTLAFINAMRRKYDELMMR